MLDEKLTKKIQEYLAQTPADRDYTAGTELLLRLNRNRFLYASLRRKRNERKLERELTKYLRIRLDGLTTAEVERMDRQEMQRAADTIARATGENPARSHGKRKDHDSLPQDIQDLYERNGEVFRKLRQTFETLKGMEDATSCDRYEYLVQLAELDRTYRANWAKYDHWTPEDAAQSAAAEAAEEQAAQDDTVQTVADPKAVSAARKYLSSNRKALAEMPESEARTLLLVKMQKRVDFLLGAHQSFEPEYQQALEALGLHF